MNLTEEELETPFGTEKPSLLCDSWYLFWKSCDNFTKAHSWQREDNSLSLISKGPQGFQYSNQAVRTMQIEN
jgi:hypothetical protein